MAGDLHSPALGSSEIGSLEFSQSASIRKMLNSQENLRKVVDIGRQLMLAKDQVKYNEENTGSCLHPRLA